MTIINELQLQIARVLFVQNFIASWRPSINDVGNWKGKGSKIGQNCQWIVLKKLPTGGGGVKNPEKLPMSFMDDLLRIMIFSCYF